MYVYIYIYMYICVAAPHPPPPKYLPFSVFPDQVRSSAHRFCISSSRVLACTCAYLSRSPSQSQMGEIVLSHSPKVVLSHAVLEPGAQCRTLKTSGPLRTFARQDAQNHETCQCFWAPIRPKHWDLSALSKARTFKTMRGPNVLGSYISKTLNWEISALVLSRSPNVLGFRSAKAPMTWFSAEKPFSSKIEYDS